MRHYFGYDIDGVLRSMETYGPTGWPSDACMADPDCAAEAALSLRASRSNKNPEIIGWVLFDCCCDPSQGCCLRDCHCIGDKFAESYVDVSTKTIKAKPMRTVYVDDVVVKSRDTITKSPGTVVTLKIVSANMPDGEKVKCVQKGVIDLALEDEWELTFTGGETDTKTLTAPSQGTKGGVHLHGRYMRPHHFLLRGFATS